MGKVIVHWDSSERLLTVEDTGTGMTRSIIDNHLMRVGVSFYDSVPVLTEHRDFSPISRFGIGILTCFMVSNDIDVITCREAKAYRLRMTQVQSDYALRELTQGDPQLAGLEPHGTRVILRIREGVNLADRSIEDIVRHWIILPECPIEYVEDRKKAIRIGFDCPSAAVEYLGALSRRSTELDSLEVVVKKYSELEEFEDASIQVNYDMAIAVRKSLLPERQFVESIGDRLPVVCIEGIRVADSLPGFPTLQTRGLAAVLSVRGSRRFRTTVSRSGLEEDEKYTRVAEVCTQLLFDHARDEVARIVAGPGRPLSQASAAFHWLYSQIDKKTEARARKYLLALRVEFPFIVAESDEGNLNDGRSPRQLLSLVELLRLPEFWTMDSRLVNSLGTISRDIGRELSLFEFISKLAPDLRHLRHSPFLPDPDIAMRDFQDTHIPGTVEFSRQHQFSAIQWISAGGREAALNLRRACSNEFFSAVERYRADYHRGSLNYMIDELDFRIPIFDAPIEGDSIEIQAVGGRLAAVLLRGSRPHEFWTTMREYSREAAAAGREPARFSDVILAVSAFFRWVSQTRGAYQSPREIWATMWAAVDAKTRSALALPQNPSEIIAPEAIFTARTYWRQWFDYE
jgi:molecular chaperone HtpG